MPSDVRRSARGAPPTTAKPPPPASTTSSSSLSSGRQDRSIKLNNNPKSATPRSLSSEDISEPPRRSQRAHQPKEIEASKETIDADEDVADEEEITRCICGQQDYPGPPLSEAFNEVDAQSEDAGGLFISCDGCSVWQHGGCVGIIEESKVPDKYYCEECKPKLHELHTDANGQKYSLYQPVNGKTNRKASVSKHGDKAQRERDALRASAESQSGPGRRRATMRSKEHDEEEEAFRRAIEESKRLAGTGIGKRGGKRVRDVDSEDNKQAIKRQRTASESIPSNTRKPSAVDESDDEPNSTLRVKKSKSEVVQSSRQADAHENEKEREKIRAEAAGRRQERAGRRRADDEAAEETPKPSASTKTSPPPSSQPGSPPETNGTEKLAPKKPGPKKKKLGNNQYTNKPNDASSPHGKKRNLTGTSSGEENLANGDSHQDSATATRKNSPDHVTSGKGKFGRGKGKGVNGNGAKHEDPADLTLATMKRRMEAMSAFIARAQLELSGEKTPLRELGSASPAGIGLGGAVQPPTLRSTPAPTSSGKAMDEMNALELAEVVSTSIAGWHRQFDHLV